MNAPLPTSIDAALAMASRLRSEMTARGFEVTSLDSLEILAATCGIASWERMRQAMISLERLRSDGVERSIRIFFGLETCGSSRMAETVSNVILTHAGTGHLTCEDLDHVRSFLKVTLETLEDWCRENHVEITPDMIVSSLIIGDGSRYRECTTCPEENHPHALDLVSWSVSTGGLLGGDLASFFRKFPGYREDLAIRGLPQSAIFSIAASRMMSVTYATLQDVLVHARGEE